MVDAEANNIVVVDSIIDSTPTPSEDDSIVSESFTFGIFETNEVYQVNQLKLLSPSSFSILNNPILDLGNERVRVYISKKLENGTETGKVDWVAFTYTGECRYG